MVARTTQLSGMANAINDKGVVRNNALNDDITPGDEYFDQVRSYLRDHQLGIQRMREDLLKIQRDIDIMKSAQGT